APLDRVDDADVGAAGAILPAAARISRQRCPRVENPSGCAQVYLAVFVATSAKFRRISRRRAGLIAGSGSSRAASAMDAAAGPCRAVGAGFPAPRTGCD